MWLGNYYSFLFVGFDSSDVDFAHDDTYEYIYEEPARNNAG